ncbi:conserved hypothetical protein [Roseovarius sp. EC-HK134]|jgi:hypothetical protein|uniref:DUF2948 family protein n=1 Tax=Roseovarius mucosus TaxID=215743 RepID=A0A1V0RR31_9RHOB|nr:MULTISPECIES: DUF2948 family protein [Roseovarius]ARE84227.1 hypothetical protein ROSMUCSMR3_02759 [Roseovarius mucosus]AWZ19129.1 Hypothetical protein RAK1035_0418 [Roseovarius sp. AK1035]EDM33305.1 hypothetical protein RTM1035_15012 [Roseovarius sp. TM1035]MBW4974708.1 DUF2948 family protein [Roseovarius mucosus]VVT07360.1 conserved hypothetical protein [Roseovarius sp. EC-HK134]|tara:strand:- start:208 stop:678 length:471 start_codon:yes stop_codon:yes gene_type:complete
MTEDAKFEDGREAPLNLGAIEEDDLKVISSLAQDAVFPITEMTWRPGQRRFGLLLNRFRWEDQGLKRHGPERVQALLVVDNVLRVASQGINRHDKDTILSLLAITFEPGSEGAGHVLLTLAGDGALRLEVEALEVTLKDVTRPYRAPSGKVPHHES